MNWTTHPTQRTATRTQQERWSQAILTRDPHCRIQGPHCTGQSTEADHIHNVREGGSELDLNNGQGACHNCHNEKTQSEAQYGQNRWKRKPETHPGLKQTRRWGAPSPPPPPPTARRSH